MAAARVTGLHGCWTGWRSSLASAPHRSDSYERLPEDGELETSMEPTSMRCSKDRSNGSDPSSAWIVSTRCGERCSTGCWSRLSRSDCGRDPRGCRHRASPRWLTEGAHKQRRSMEPGERPPVEMLCPERWPSGNTVCVSKGAAIPNVPESTVRGLPRRSCLTAPDSPRLPIGISE